MQGSGEDAQLLRLLHQRGELPELVHLTPELDQRPAEVLRKGELSGHEEALGDELSIGGAHGDHILVSADMESLHV
jgi:hypothetical protein